MVLLAAVVAAPAACGGGSGEEPGDPAGAVATGSGGWGKEGTGTGGTRRGSGGTMNPGGAATGGATTTAPGSGGAGSTGMPGGGSGGTGSGSPPPGGSGGGGTPPGGSGGFGSGGSGAGGIASGGGTGGAASAPAAGTIVPLYTRPDHASWAQLAASKIAHPAVQVVAVVNPANGPGTTAESAYQNGISNLANAGVRVLGYVYTEYGKRAATAVQADIDRWKRFYPAISGIFFDEQAYTPGYEDHYRRLTAYARTAGAPFTVGNPGVDSQASYVGTVDLILIYESPGLPPLSQLEGWHSGYDRRGFGIIPHAVPSLDTGFVAEAKKRVGYIYIQSDTKPNPWDSIPPYFNALLAALQ
jgi:hypothetical protein